MLWILLVSGLKPIMSRESADILPGSATGSILVKNIKNLSLCSFCPFFLPAVEISKSAEFNGTGFHVNFAVGAGAFQFCSILRPPRTQLHSGSKLRYVEMTSQKLCWDVFQWKLGQLGSMLKLHIDQNQKSRYKGLIWAGSMRLATPS